MAKMYPFVAGFLILKLGFLLCLYALTSGTEIASDVDFLLLLAENPLGFLFGTTAEDVASYAPLEGLLLFLLTGPPGFLVGDFISFRVIFILFEAAAIVLLVKAALPNTENRNPEKTKSSSFWCLAAMFLAPHLIMSIVVSVQDETIGFFWMCLAIFCLVKQNKSGCLLSLVAGVLTTKVFFIVPYFYILFFYNFKPRDILTAIPILLIYGITFLSANAVDGNLPFKGFTPSASHSAYFWALIIKFEVLSEIDSVKNTSLLLTIATQSVFALAISRQLWRQSSVRQGIMMIGGSLTLFFLTFYQHNPEYLLLITPAVWCLAPSLSVLLAANFIFALAWLPKLIMSLVNVIDGFGTKAPDRLELLQPFLNKFNISFVEITPYLDFSHTFLVVVYSLLYTFLTFWWMKNLAASIRNTQEYSHLATINQGSYISRAY